MKSIILRPRSVRAWAVVGVSLLGSVVGRSATTDYFDLTGTGRILDINGATVFTGAGSQSTGSGTFNSYLGVNAGGATPIETGLSTSSNNINDAMSDVDFTKTAAFGFANLTSASTTINGSGSYYAFYFDILETGGGSGGQYLSLDSLTIYKASDTYNSNSAGNPNVDATDLQNFISNTDASVVWSLDDLGVDKYTPTQDRSILTDATGKGSGTGDFYVLIPASKFVASGSGTDYFYIYAEFGAAGTQTISSGTYSFVNSGGFEEIGIASNLGDFTSLPAIITAIPEASASTALPWAFGVLSLLHMRRTRRSRVG